MPEYDNGGILPMGIGTFVTGESERVFTAEQMAEIQAKLDILTEDYNELKRQLEDDED